MWDFGSHYLGSNPSGPANREGSMTVQRIRRSWFEWHYRKRIVIKKRAYIFNVECFKSQLALSLGLSWGSSKELAAILGPVLLSLEVIRYRHRPLPTSGPLRDFDSDPDGDW